MISMNLFQKVPQGIIIKIAETKSELEQAYKIIHDNYVSIGFIQPNKNQMRITFYNALPQTTTIVAKLEDKVIGCMTVINNDQLILPLERELADDICLTPAFRKAQILDFAILNEFKFSNVNFLLMRYTYTYIKDYLHVDSVQIAVLPFHGRFFKNRLGFKNLNISYADSQLSGRQLDVYTLDLAEGYDFLAIHHGKKNKAKNLFYYFTKSHFDQTFQYPKRKYHSSNDPVLTPELIDYFFNRKTNIFEQLSPEQSDYINYIYQDLSYNVYIPHVLTSLSFYNQRKGKRYPVNCKAQITSPTLLEIAINNVSPRGFSARLNDSEILVLGDIFDLNILTSDYEIAQIKAKVVWKKSQKEYGFCLIKSTANWDDFITHLDQRLIKQDSEDSFYKKTA